VTSPLDRYSQPTLVLGTGSRFATRYNFAVAVEKPLQAIYVFVVDGLRLVSAERAHFAPTAISPGTALSSSRWIASLRTFAPGSGDSLVIEFFFVVIRLGIVDFFFDQFFVVDSFFCHV
jgi:hypothetical protein